MACGAIARRNMEPAKTSGRTTTAPLSEVNAKRTPFDRDASATYGQPQGHAQQVLTDSPIKPPPEQRFVPTAAVAVEGGACPHTDKSHARPHCFVTPRS